MIKNLLFYIGILFGFASFAQNTDSTGGMFVGRWHSLGIADTLDIQRNGAKFTVQSQGAYTVFSLEDGALKNEGSNPSRIIYNSMNGHIFWRGKEYEYIDVAAAQSGNSTPADNAASTPQSVSSGSAAPAYGLVKDNLSGPLAQRESVLYRYSGDVGHPNQMFYVDYNFHEQDYRNQHVVEAVLGGIEGTNRFTRIPFEKYQQHQDDSIFYIVTYSNPFASFTNTTSIDRYGTVLYNFTASIGITLTITDYSGKTLYTKPFTYGATGGERFHLLRYGTEEEAARQSSKKMAEKISNYFIETFPVNTYVISLDETSKDGSAKTIVINGGENMGLYSHPELSFKIMCDGNKIGEVRVKKVDDKTSICKVEDGGNAIAAKIAAGAKLQAISE